MHLKQLDVVKFSRAERQFREAFERLKQGKPQIIPRGSKVSQNNVAKEAGVDSSALRRARFPNLVAEIKAWLEEHQEEDQQKSSRQLVMEQRARNRGLRGNMEALQAQRDDALSRLIDAQARILELTNENERLRRQLPPSNIKAIFPTEKSR